MVCCTLESLKTPSLEGQKWIALPEEREIGALNGRRAESIKIAWWEHGQRQTAERQKF